MDNLTPGYKFSEGMEQDFFSIFSIFFPSVAGIQAGASLSGDSKVKLSVNISILFGNLVGHAFEF